MSTRYEIRAEPPREIPVYSIGMWFTVTTGGGGIETRVLVSARRLVIQDDWGMEWPGSDRETDPEVARLLGRLGLQMIEDSLRSGKDVTPNLQITAEAYACGRPRFVKSCLYQERRQAGLFCTVAGLEDPRCGATTDLLCTGCQIPDKAQVCSELVNIKTTWLHEGTEPGRRKVLHADCNAGHDLRTGTNCMPGLQECWIRRLELH